MDSSYSNHSSLELYSEWLDDWFSLHTRIPQSYVKKLIVTSPDKDEYEQPVTIKEKENPKCKKELSILKILYTQCIPIELYSSNWETVYVQVQ